MRGSLRGLVLALIAASGGVGLAIALGSSAGAAGQTTTTLGSTTGTPSQNVCAASINCTYLPFSNAGAPQLQVPFDGTVTSFSVNSGSANSQIYLRVLRPAGNGQFTGVGTSPVETTAGGPQTFTVSLPVKAGDVLGLDNASSALLFDTTNPTAVTWYYQPGLADGATGAPNQRSAYRLLLSAVVQSSGTTPTTSSTTTTTGANGTTTVVITKTVPGPPPVLSRARQARRAWRTPKGTTFSFRLNERALVNLTFRRRGRVIGTVSLLGHRAVNRVRFKGVPSNGKTLATGRYTVTLLALTAGGQSKPAKLSFKITG